MEMEPKKLKGKRDVIMTKSFQQVDFWCKCLVSEGKAPLLLVWTLVFPVSLGQEGGDKFAFSPEKIGMVSREIVAQKQLVHEGARQK